MKHLSSNPLLVLILILSVVSFSQCFIKTLNKAKILNATKVKLFHKAANGYEYYIFHTPILFEVKHESDFNM